jgi:tetratricopeptide (TPR) repeat protein
MRSFTKFRIGKLLICLFFIGIFSVSSFAQEEWYLVFGSGQAGKRAVFFVDMNSVTTVSTGTQSITFVNVFEEPGNPQYTSSKMEFRCKSNEYRIASGENYTFQNTSVSFKDSPWQKADSLLIEQVRKFACDKPSFDAARETAKDAQGRVNNDKLNEILTKVGLGGIPILLMTNEYMPDFEAILNVVWTKFWNANRPPRTGVAQKKPNKDVPPSSNQSAEALVKLAAEQVRIQYYDQAIVYLKQALKADPLYAPTFFYLGYIFADVGEFDAALTNYNRAIELNSNDISSYWNRGLIYFEQKHLFDRAEADFNKAVQSDPQEAKYYFYRANLYESWGKDNLAEADRKKFKSLGGNALQGFENARRTLFPAAQFDARIAANALQQGSSTLIGRACASVKNGMWGLGGTDRFKATNVRVVLYPATPYLEKWYDLREKKEDKKTGVFINREAQKYALVTQTNGNGEFVFSRLKPGRYFIQIIFNFTQVRSKRIYTGSTQDGNVVTDWYADRDFYIDRKTRLEKFVEIKSDGASEKVMVKNGLWGC